MTNERMIPETLFEFQERFSTEESCESFLFAWRWPEGFRCPRCDGSDSVKLAHRRQHQCRECKYQVSITAGTAMHGSKLKLRVWFWAMFLVARHKKSISALQLQADLGIGQYRTAWLLLHKIRQCFSESADYPLRGTIEVDETLIGSKSKGAKPGKAPANKAIVVAAVELGPSTKRGCCWAAVRARQVPDYTKKSLGGFVKDVVEKGSTTKLDGWRAYNHLDEDYKLKREVSSALNAREMRDADPMPHVHLFFSNLKTWLTGRFHGVSKKYLSTYINEFVYRLNRRQDPPEIFGWVARRLMTKPPTTLQLLLSYDSNA